MNLPKITLFVCLIATAWCCSADRAWAGEKGAAPLDLTQLPPCSSDPSIDLDDGCFDQLNNVIHAGGPIPETLARMTGKKNDCIPLSYDQLQSAVISSLLAHFSPDSSLVGGNMRWQDANTFSAKMKINLTGEVYAVGGTVQRNCGPDVAEPGRNVCRFTIPFVPTVRGIESVTAIAPYEPGEDCIREKKVRIQWKVEDGFFHDAKLAVLNLLSPSYKKSVLASISEYLDKIQGIPGNGGPGGGYEDGGGGAGAQ